jgi:hypothetical protein
MAWTHPLTGVSTAIGLTSATREGGARTERGSAGRADLIHGGAVSATGRIYRYLGLSYKVS